MSVTRGNVPGTIDTRRIVARECMTAARIMLQHWTPKDHQGISKQSAIAAAHQVFGYVPASVWSRDHALPFWGVKDVGRPDPSPSNGSKSKSSNGSKRTATSNGSKSKSKRTASKSTATKRTATKSTATKVPTKSPAAQSKDNAVHASARVASPATVAALHASLPTSEHPTS